MRECASGEDQVLTRQQTPGRADCPSLGGLLGGLAGSGRF